MISDYNYKLFRTFFYICVLLLAISIIVGGVFHFAPITISFTTKQCFFKYATHLYCPGCGGTRAINALIRFKFVDVCKYNASVFFVIFTLAKYYGYGIYTFIMKRDGKLYHGNVALDVIIVVGLILVYSIIRNILMTTGIWDCIGECGSFWL